jgi:hypothetical protein
MMEGSVADLGKISAQLVLSASYCVVVVVVVVVGKLGVEPLWKRHLCHLQGFVGTNVYNYILHQCCPIL